MLGISDNLLFSWKKGKGQHSDWRNSTFGLDVQITTIGFWKKAIEFAQPFWIPMQIGMQWRTRLWKYIVKNHYVIHHFNYWIFNKNLTQWVIFAKFFGNFFGNFFVQFFWQLFLPIFQIFVKFCQVLPTFCSLLNID